MSNVYPINATVPYAATASQSALVSGTGSTDTSQNIDAVSQDFESVFLSQMLEAMFSGSEFTAYFGGGTAGDVSKSYMLDQLGKSMAASGGVGVAGYVKQELLKLQEVA